MLISVLWLGPAYGVKLNKEEAIPELEIDVDELLDMPSDLERAARVKELAVECFKPTEFPGFLCSASLQNV
ncbi:unnamed protein product [Arctogadus glacialis]